MLITSDITSVRKEENQPLSSNVIISAVVMVRS